MEAIKYQYKCKGCGKIYNTYKYYPDGQWICLSCRDTTKVTLKCSECGSEFYVYWDTYRMKDPNTPWRCRSCNDKYRNRLYETKSEEEKKAFIEQQKARAKQYWSNLSEEDKKKDSDRRKKLWEERFKNGEAEFILNSLKKGRSDWWNSLSDEEKFKQWKYLDDGRRDWMNAMSDEEYENWKRMVGYYSRIQWSKLSKEEREKRLKPLHDGCIKYWHDMTPEQYQQWQLNFHKGYSEYLDKIDPNNQWVEPNKNEAAFIQLLNAQNIKYNFQYPNSTIHPDFNTVFPINPVTKATLINPIHMWDFKIHTLESDVFIDVDGSMHFKDTYNKTHPYTGVTYKELDYKKFLDSQRPYQTDGLPAYAVLAYDDNLTNDTPVINIINNEKMIVKTLIERLYWMNVPPDERSKLLKLI